MIYVGLVLLGLCLGSFVNALVWRLRQQERPAGKRSKAESRKYSILQGRSMCPHCKHELAAKDLVPVASWLWLGGKCRYCRKPISAQYPLVEAAGAGLFAASYAFWPVSLHASGWQIVVFGLWLLVLVGLLALLVYDLHWMLLPNRLMLPTGIVAALLTCVEVASAVHPAKALLDTALGVVVGGGIFYVIFQLSKGRWIGGGDVKLGLLLGLVVASPGKSLLVILLASVLGTLVALPLLLSKRLRATSTIPFGPFLIAAAIVTVLFGSDIIHWYSHTFLLIG